jgi:hypothetical protein
MICGNCKKRDVNIAHVKTCSATTNKTRANVSQTYSNLSAKQQSWLRDLLVKYKLLLDDGFTVETISYETGKPILDALISARRNQAKGETFTFPKGVSLRPDQADHGERTPSTPELPACPDGYYAVPDWTGKEQYKFFWVHTKKRGRSKGKRYVEQVFGGSPNTPAYGKFAVRAVEEIIEYGPEDAGFMFAKKLKHCCKCRKHLTKKASREVGMGRHCAYQNNLGEDWDALNWKFNDADADDLEDEDGE